MKYATISRLQLAMLLVNAVGTGVAAVVLAIWPAAIPNIVGVDLRPDQFVLAYFLSGSEAAVCVMCVQGLRAALATRILLLRSLLVFHVATALLSTVAVFNGSSRLILWNVALRIVLALLIGVSLVKRDAGNLSTL